MPPAEARPRRAGRVAPPPSCPLAIASRVPSGLNWSSRTGRPVLYERLPPPGRGVEGQHVPVVVTGHDGPPARGHGDREHAAAVAAQHADRGRAAQQRGQQVAARGGRVVERDGLRGRAAASGPARARTAPGRRAAAPRRCAPRCARCRAGRAPRARRSRPPRAAATRRPGRAAAGAAHARRRPARVEERALRGVQLAPRGRSATRAPRRAARRDTGRRGRDRPRPTHGRRR